MTRFYIYIIPLLYVSLLQSQKTFLRENFNYPAASLLTANGWYSHSSGATNPIVVAAEGLSLTKTAYIGSGKGLAAAVFNNGSDENRPFDNNIWADTSDVYASFLVKATADIITATNPYFFHFIQYMNPTTPVFTSANTSYRARVFSIPGTTTGKFKIGITFNSNAVTDGGQTDDLNVGETYLVVVKYTFVSGQDNDVVSLYVFKDGDNIDTEPSKPTAGPFGKTGATSAPDLAAIQGVTLRQFTATQNIIVDGIYVRNHWNLTSEGTSHAKDISTSSLQIYPNPTPDRIVNISNSLNTPLYVSVYDATGRIMYHGNVENNQIDLSSCQKGMYILKLTQNNETVSKKIVLH